MSRPFFSITSRNKFFPPLFNSSSSSLLPISYLLKRMFRSKFELLHQNAGMKLVVQITVLYQKGASMFLSVFLFFKGNLIHNLTIPGRLMVLVQNNNKIWEILYPFNTKNFTNRHNEILTSRKFLILFPLLLGTLISFQKFTVRDSRVEWEYTP